MTTIPILGNQGFSGVNTNSSQIPRLNAARAHIPNLSAQTINGNYFWLRGIPGKKLFKLTGNSSSTFGTLSDGQVQFLNAQPDQPASLTVAGGVLVIPPGAVIIAAYVLDKGLNGTTSLNIGTRAITGAAPGVSANIFAEASRTVINTDGSLVSSQPVLSDTSAVATPGIIASGSTPITVSLTGSTGLVVSPLDDVTSSGGLTVTIYYYL